MHLLALLLLAAGLGTAPATGPAAPPCLKGFIAASGRGDVAGQLALAGTPFVLDGISLDRPALEAYLADKSERYPDPVHLQGIEPLGKDRYLVRTIYLQTESAGVYTVEPSRCRVVGKDYRVTAEHHDMARLTMAH